MSTPFQPGYTKGQSVSPAAAAASITIEANARQVCLTNLGAAVCHVRIGNGAIAATTADYPVPPGLQMIISKTQGEDVLSHISATGTTLHVMTGQGL